MASIASGPRAILRGLAVLSLTCMPILAEAQDKQPLVIARDMDLTSLDPQRAFCDTCMIFNASVYETLVTLDPEQKIAPLLAASWEVSADQKTFTFKLDPNARFSDGTPVEAKDIKWSWERLKNLKSNAAFFAAPIQSIETPDAAAVVVTTKVPNSEFLNIITSTFMGITNSDVAEANGARADEGSETSDTAEPWFMSHSAGSGPYVLASFEPQSELRLEANPNYWREKPHFDNVVMLQVKDAVSQAQMLQSGSVDIAMQVDADTAKSLEGSEIKVDNFPSSNFVFIAVSPGAKSNPVPLTGKVREAISMAIDRQGILDITVAGNGRLMSAPIPLDFPGGAGFDPVPYDPEKAKALLAEAGYPDGFKLEAAFPALNVYGVDFSLMLQKVQIDLAKIGIELSLVPLEFSTFRSRVTGDGIPLTASYHAPDYFGTSQYLDVFAMMPGTTWSKRAGVERDGADFTYNAAIPDLYQKALASTPAEAEAYWHQAGQAMLDDHIIMPILSPNLILAYNPKLTGVAYTAAGVIWLSEVAPAQ